MDKWLSLLEDNHDEIAEMTSLPALQGMLERMESMAGRIVANELMAVAEDGYGALDDIGGEKLRQICQEFHETCTKVNREQEIENLHWRVQQISSGQDYLTEPTIVNQTGDDAYNTTVMHADAGNLKIQRLVLRTTQLCQKKPPLNAQPSFECPHQGKRALGGAQTFGALLARLTSVMEIACGASSDRSP